jgi:hypothetical protein
MNILNEKIQHKTFGEGTVINQDTSKISIAFREQYGVKQFIYPDAFEEFLKLNNSDLESSVVQELHEKQAHIEAKRLQKHQEDEVNRLRALELIKTPKKKLATKSRTSRAKSNK